jgi:hypothetical protein
MFLEVELNVIERLATAADVALGIAQEVGELLIFDAETGALIG